MSALNVRMVPISLLGEVLLGKMVQPSRKNETDELRPYLRAAHLPAPGTLSLDVSEQQMYFSPHEIDRLDLRKSDVVIVEGGRVMDVLRTSTMTWTGGDFKTLSFACVLTRVCR